MARSHVVTNGFHANGDALPPSTLAAQIVQNQVRPTVSHQSEQQALFSSLLHEILHNSTADIETDVSTNVQLIKVLVEAGLSGIAHEHPFAADILSQQAKDSVAVITKTIQRQSEVLSTFVLENGPPVCIWLFARAAAILRQQSIDHEPILELLRTITQVLSKSTKHWRLAKVYKDIIVESMVDIVIALETATNLAQLEVVIPPARLLAQVLSQAEGVITAAQDYQIALHEPAQACIVAIHLSTLPHVPPARSRDVSMRILKIAFRFYGTPVVHRVWIDILGMLLKCSPQDVQAHVIDTMIVRLSTHESMPRSIQQQLVAIFRSETHDQHLASLARRLQNNTRFESLEAELKDAITTCAAVTLLPSKLSESRHHIHRGQALRPSNANVKPAIEFFSNNGSLDSDSILQRFHGLDAQSQPLAWRQLLYASHEHHKAVLQALPSLLAKSSLQSNPPLRVLALQIARNCIKETTEHFDIATTRIGRAVLQGLQSSSRDVRIAAGNCIPAILEQVESSAQQVQNRRTLLQYLRQLSSDSVLAIQESLIPVWGFMAKACDTDELNLVLLRLVDYFGHANSLIRGLAFTELQNIAVIKAAVGGVETLFAQYWSTIAVSVVQDLFTCPQKAQMLCDLIGKDVTEFLVMTQVHTVPHLVVTKRRDVLQRIASARSSTTAVRDICIHPRQNLIAVMSHLICQCGLDSEDFAMSCLTAADPSFAGEDLGDYIKLDSTAIACEVLKHAGQQDNDDKVKARESFQVLADLCERNPGQRRSHSKSSRAVAAFLRRHILGILTGFSSVIEAGQDSQNARNKIVCLKGTAEMIVLGKDEINNALPQLRALLQSAVEQPTLCETAWSTWLTLLPILEEEDIELIVEQTFVLIIRHWSSMSTDLQERTHAVVGDIVRTASGLITNRVLQLPSLSGIPLFAKIGGQIDLVWAGETVENYYKAAAKRLTGENPLVVIQALKDLVVYLESKQSAIHEISTSEHPSQSLADLTRSLLDASLSLSKTNSDAAVLCGKALGLLGCLDPNRVEATRKRETVLVLSNFEKADEVVRWVVVLLEDYLVKAFKSVTNAQAQGFMAYVIQELLKFCGFDQDVALRPRSTQTGRNSQRWQSMPEHVRTTLTPFMSSKYTVTTSASFNQPQRAYPGFKSDSSYSSWLRGLVYDLTWKAKGENAKILFPHLARIVRGHHLVIASFLLPYVVLNIVLAGTVTEVNDIRQEFLEVLSYPNESTTQFETVKLCSESVFSALDYMTIWLQEKRRVLTETRASAYRTGVSPGDFDEIKDMAQVDTVQAFLSTIPADLLAQRALDCGAYARALFNWEQYIRQTKPIVPSKLKAPDEDDSCYYRLHDIYAQIDEPDGLEGISAHLTFLTEEQQATLHARSGRWTAAQAWYESKLANDQGNEELQGALLQCLQETGRYSALMRYAQSIKASQDRSNAGFFDPYMVEAAWMTDDVTALKDTLRHVTSSTSNNFGIGMGRLLLASLEKDSAQCDDLLRSLRTSVTTGMTSASTGSLQASHEDLKRLHLLAEVEIINAALRNGGVDSQLATMLDKRLDVLGTLNADKQAVLAVRRVLLSGEGPSMCNHIAATAWLTSARLARKQSNIESAYHAVLQASEAGANGAKLQEAKLLWHEGHHRQALSALDQAIEAGVFGDTKHTQSTSAPSMPDPKKEPQNPILAKARLIYIKWLDAAGQTQGREMSARYRLASSTFQRWEKGYYHLGKHYSRLLEAEKSLPKAKQSARLVAGELAKLAVENLLRSLPFGNKYWYESVPKILTLWFDLGVEVLNKSSREDSSLSDYRAKCLSVIHKQLRKYTERTPAFIYYAALPQMLSRVSHPHADVWLELMRIILRIANAHPAQSLWSILALAKATDKARLERGRELISKLGNGEGKNEPLQDVRLLINSGTRLCNGLLTASEAAVDARATSASLSRDLHFKMQLAPSGLVVPIESTLMINLPSTSDPNRIRNHKPFVQNKVTIQSFQDNVLVLSSLQRPKKLTLRGSDGKLYGLLCKPKDDLRKDQRLMEFNGIINRALKRDAAGSKRRLYIKTYAVTPLSEESGCLEWVEGIKPIRDILLTLYTRRGIRPNYTEIRNDLNEACKSPDNTWIFTDKVQAKFPATLHEWFTEVFPEPDTWFASRLRYARSAAVMSMTGHVLGLGDRHGENILLQESTGGVFHVDFNCLFDKGLTFEKPEVVPFRLTRNMTDAMGPYGHDGPFRKSCEVTLGLLRQNKDTLMTVLETFVHDPTTDFIGKKKRNIPGVPETPEEILDSVNQKLKGLLRGEAMALSVEGYVDALIVEAVSSWNLSQMYIGWCAFL